MEDVINFMTICFQGILINVLDHHTYEAPPGDNSMYLHEAYDVNGLSCRDRRAYVYIRRISWELLLWFMASYRVQNCSGAEVDVWSEMCLPYLACQARAILLYKKASSDDGLPGATLANISMQLFACIRLFPQVLFALAKEEANPSDFAYVWERSHIISKCNDKATQCQSIFISFLPYILISI